MKNEKVTAGTFTTSNQITRGINSVTKDNPPSVSILKVLYHAMNHFIYKFNEVGDKFVKSSDLEKARIYNLSLVSETPDLEYALTVKDAFKLNVADEENPKVVSFENYITGKKFTNPNYSKEVLAEIASIKKEYVEENGSNMTKPYAYKGKIITASSRKEAIKVFAGKNNNKFRTQQVIDALYKKFDPDFGGLNNWSCNLGKNNTVFIYHKDLTFKIQIKTNLQEIHLTLYGGKAILDNRVYCYFEFDNFKSYMDYIIKHIRTLDKLH